MADRLGERPEPRAARCSRTSSAMYSKNVSTNSGLPLKRARSSGFCVATPTGQVSRWQTRIMMQPLTTSGAVAKPYSSAPSSAAITTSRPVFIWPSVCTTMRSRRPLSSSVCCVSARPSSHGRAGVLQRVERRGAGAAVVAGDEHDVGLRLRHAGRHRAHPDLGDQLHVHPRLRVGVLQVVDELLEVLDRVDVVVRRRRDQADARRGVPGLGDPRVHLAAGQLAALAGLGALGHLDLQVVGVGEVLRGDAEATRRHLLDGAAPLRVVEALGVLAALAGVRLAAEAVHGDGERLVRLHRDRAVAHRAGGEALDDLAHRLDLVDRHRRRASPVLEPEQAAERGELAGLVVDAGRVLLEDVVALRARGVLELEHRLRVEEVVLALAAPLVLAARPTGRGGRPPRDGRGRRTGGGRPPPRRARRGRRR